MTTYRIGRDEREGACRLGRRLAASLLALSLLTGVLAGCGSSERSGDGVASEGGNAMPTATSGESPAADSHDRALQFTRCLRGQELDVQDPGPDGRPKLGKDVDSAKLQAALKACRQYAPDVLNNGRLSPEEREQMLAYTTCLREHGIAIGDPDPETGMPQRKDFSKFREPDAAMREAQQACVDKRPTWLGHQS